RMRMRWTIGDVVSETGRAFARSWPALVVGNLIIGVIAYGPVLATGMVVGVWSAASGKRGDGWPFPPAALVPIGLSVVGALVVAILFAPALSRMALAAARGQQPRIADIFNFQRAGTYFVAALLSALAIFGGTLLLIVPGIIVAIGLSFASF